MSARWCWLAWPQAPVPNDEHIAGLDCVAFTAAYECEIVAEDESGGGAVWPVHRNLLDGEIFYALREAPGLQTTGTRSVPARIRQAGPQTAPTATLHELLAS